MSEWRAIKLAPAGEVVETKIDDEDGERNVQLMRREGNLWFVPDSSMYVYYRPTHWRRPTPEQMETLARRADEEARRHSDRARRYRAGVHQ